MDDQPIFSPSTLIINVFSFLIKIALFCWPFIWKHTISHGLSKAAIQSELYSQKTPNQQLGHEFGVVEGVSGVLGVSGLSGDAG